MPKSTMYYLYIHMYLRILVASEGKRENETGWGESKNK